MLLAGFLAGDDHSSLHRLGLFRGPELSEVFCIVSLCARPPGARDLRYASEFVLAIAVEEVYVGIDEAGVGKPEKAAMHTGCE